MTTYYVDHAGSNTAPYDTQAKAAPALATILAIPPAAGDIIYCCDNAGTGETIAATLDFTGVAGTNAGGWIKIIGCNSSGVVDGTRYYINANSGSYHVLTLVANSDMIWFENIEFGNTNTGTYHGIYCSASSSDGLVFINCCAHNCGSYGFNLGNSTRSLLYRCCSYLNGNIGFSGSGSYFYFCCARDNTGVGFSPSASTTLVACVSHSNSDDGFAIGTGCGLFNCVSDRNSDDGVVIGNTTLLSSTHLIGCRITNHNGSGDIGLKGAADGNDEPFITALCYFEDNDTDISDDTLHQIIPLENSATSSNVAGTPDTNAGYVNETESTAGTTNLSTNYVSGTDPTLRRTAVTIPFD